MQCPEIISYTHQCLYNPQLFEPNIFSSRIDILNNHQLLTLRDKIEQMSGNALRAANGRWRDSHNVLCQKLALEQGAYGIVAGIWNLGFCLDHLFSPNVNGSCGSVAHSSGSGLLLALSTKKLVFFRLRMRKIVARRSEEIDNIDRISKHMNAVLGDRCKLAKRRNQSVFEQSGNEILEIGDAHNPSLDTPNSSSARILKLPFQNHVGQLLRG